MVSAPLLNCDGRIEKAQAPNYDVLETQVKTVQQPQSPVVELQKPSLKMGTGESAQIDQRQVDGIERSRVWCSIRSKFGTFPLCLGKGKVDDVAWRHWEQLAGVEVKDKKNGYNVAKFRGASDGMTSV
ncbi:unnamed protein product [Calypogeia fissa]